ncbi:GTPase HflX [Brevirhabdus sp.]|uniref:GTPase HflX n=1 Tax=Brevirhabdus sp. TaxID=2004514 RepID=UPI004058623F
MIESFDTSTPATRAWVLHPELKADRHKRRGASHALEEAVSLGDALPGLDMVGADVVPLPKVNPGLLFGTGKIEELRRKFEDHEVDLVLIDGPVTPVQQRNLEKRWKVKILDRTGLILEIFSDRARTREGVLQVEMAALSYQRTRLVRAWTHLERQRGGLGFVGGPGETQIEADRRAIDEAVTKLRRQLSKVVKTRELHRAARKKIPYPVVALVGYTNAGKSTLFNRMTGASVTAEDMLFATLDPTMRAVELPGGLKVILSDTVGFISDLPTQLVAAFRATLEEVLDADLIVHVRDISHPESEEQSKDVHDILTEMGVDEAARRLEVWNKLDRLDDAAKSARATTAEREPDIIALSALTGEGMEALFDTITDALDPPRLQERLVLGHAQGRARAWLFEQDVVTDESQTEDGVILTVSWTERQKARFSKL